MTRRTASAETTTGLRSGLRSRRRRRRLAGASLPEASIAGGVFLLLTTTLFSLSSTTMHVTDKTATEIQLAGSARQALDEALFQIRSGSQVLPTQALNSTTYTTSDTSVVLRAPGYSPTSSGLFLEGVTDGIALRYDQATRTLRETVCPGSGSVRPQRYELILAKNVANAAFTYKTRKHVQSWKTGNAVPFPLDAIPTSAPVAFVNGTRTDCAWAAGSTTVTVPISVANSDVQLVYPVDPVANNGAAAPLVGEVEVALTLSSQDSRRITRTLPLNGAARLRNWINSEGVRQ